MASGHKKKGTVLVRFFSKINPENSFRIVAHHIQAFIYQLWHCRVLPRVPQGIKHILGPGSFEKGRLPPQVVCPVQSAEGSSAVPKQSSCSTQDTELVYELLGRMGDLHYQKTFR
jgi:hypothetical protein